MESKTLQAVRFKTEAEAMLRSVKQMSSVGDAWIVELRSGQFQVVYVETDSSESV